MFNLFANINPSHFLYLIYGASFLFLGISVATKDMKGSNLVFGNGLWLLAAFGLLHGAHEWLELGTWLEETNLSIQQVTAARLGAFVLFFLSFLFLLFFGLFLFRIQDDKWKWWFKALPAFLFVIWLSYLLKHGVFIEIEFLRRAELGARYTFGLMGALMTAYGLITYAREIKTMSPSMARQLSYAGLTFFFYSLCTGVVSSGFVLPFLPVPVEFLRTIEAVFMTYFISKALNIFDIDTRNRNAAQARLLAQSERLSSLGQLAVGIAHEINNPLTNASLGVQLLKNKLAGEDADSGMVERLAAVERNIDRASVIAKELLQFHRRKEEEYVPLDANQAILSCLGLLEYRMKSITLTRDLAKLPEIMGDPVKLEQVFLNILANSLDAMPRGGMLSIASCQNDGMVEITITDTGGGIHAELQSRVFEPFFTTKDVGAGTGLGLFVSYGIISQHHGLIELASTPGVGTTVTVKLPIKEGYEEDTHCG